MPLALFYRCGLEKSRSLPKVLEEAGHGSGYSVLGSVIHVPSQPCLSLQVQILSLGEKEAAATEHS